MEGIVKWYSSEKGFGFVSIDEQSDAFLHYSELEKAGYNTINEGDIINYSLVDTGKGYRAQDISIEERGL